MLVFVGFINLHFTVLLPIAVNKRLSDISSDEQSFDAFKGDYERALRDSGHRSKLTYSPTQPETDEHHTPRKRRRDIIWFNPPFCASLKTNIGKEFLKLIDKNFPINHHLHKIINRKTVKLSYSCTENMKTIIQGHNKKLISGKNKTPDPKCNCQNKQQCPVPGNCCQDNVVYQASVNHEDGRHVMYVGCTESSFKLRFNNHTKSYRNEQYKNETTLSRYLWDNNLQNSNNIKWKYMKKCSTYTPGTTACDLCLSEKFFIIKNQNSVHSLNKRTDIANKCPHKRKHTLTML